MTRGEIYRSREPEALRGHKPGYYVVVSRNFVAASELLETVICAPVYSRWLQLDTEVLITPEEGVDHASSARCDLLMSLRKERLQHLVGRLSATQLVELDRALAIAVGLTLPVSG